MVLRRVARRKISEEDIELYKYGYTLFVEKTIILILIILIAAFLKAIRELIVFYAMFVPMRSYTGGYHTKKAYKCILVSGSVIIIYIIASRLIADNCNGLYCILAEVVLLPCICRMSPAEHKNKPLNEAEVKAYHRLVYIIYAVHMILEVVALALKWETFIVEAVLIHAIVLASLCIKSR